MKMKKILISVIMPTYNNKDIYSNVLKVKMELKKVYRNYEIIIVNDGSEKGWKEKLEKLFKIKDKRIKIISYNKNKGKGYALKKGGLFAKGKVIIFLDSDLEISPKFIFNFVEELKKVDIVIGSKRHPLSKIRYPIFRKTMSFFYQKLIYLMFNLDVKDTQVGIKAFKSEVLKKILPKIIIKRYAFDLEVLCLAKKEGYKIKEAPIEINFKLGSTINLKGVINMLIDTLAIYYRLKILKYYD